VGSVVSVVQSPGVVPQGGDSYFTRISSLSHQVSKFKHERCASDGKPSICGAFIERKDVAMFFKYELNHLRPVAKLFVVLLAAMPFMGCSSAKKQAATPAFSPAAGTFTTTQSVTITDATPGAAIYYTTDGSTPTTSSTQYTTPITVTTTETIEAIAADLYHSQSTVATATYTYTPPVPAATPAFSPAAGTYTSTQSVTITDATPGATIYYTTDGSTPNTSSTQYTAPITVAAASETIEAIATAAPGYLQSAVGTAAYTIVGGTPNLTQYVDCSSANNGIGTQAAPWNNIASANAQSLVPGSSLLFARGTTCDGELIPSGSGSAVAVITIGAYGTGAAPIINGTSGDPYALLLNDESYYEISNLAFTGGTTWGIYITGATQGATLNHIYLTNLNVSGVTAVGNQRNSSGLVGAFPACNEVFNDLEINGVVASNTTAMEGISVEGAGLCSSGSQSQGGPVTVENSTVHDVYGDGIYVALANSVSVKNNVVYNTGQCPSATCTSTVTPSGIVNWNTEAATVQGNESYSNSSWSTVDGGDFEIGAQSDNTISEYNYGHDSAGYCQAVYSQDNAPYTPTTSNSIVRYNICANNVLTDPNYGEIYADALGAGNFDGVQIYNNTIYLSTTITSNYGFVANGTYTGTVSNVFENNLIYSKSLPGMISVTATTWAISSNNNLYYNAAGTYSFVWEPGNGGGTFTSFAAYPTGSYNDSAAISVNPNLNGVIGYHSPGMPTLSSGNYTLPATSPAVAAGTFVCYSTCIAAGNGMGTQDFFGQTVAPVPDPNTTIPPGTPNPNIGAFD